MKFSAAAIGIVGAGIAGLAHAWSAARRGHRVTLFERDRLAQGASIRNFGMIWPIGQPAGAQHAAALQSRTRWLELGSQAGIWVNPCGSIHLAHRPDEMAVLEEFAGSAAARDYGCELWSPAAVVKRSPGANPQALLGGLWSPSELCVNPPAAIARIAQWLAERWDVRFEPAAAVTHIDRGRVQLAGGAEQRFERIVVCSGADFETLFPECFAASGLRRCKLQMLKTVRQPENWRLGPHLASGLTLRHYRAFADCPGLVPLRQRIADQTPELDRWGIHVMASQNDAGEIILGDSHEYDEAIDPFYKQNIEDLILRELHPILRLPTWEVAARWQGVYAKHPERTHFEAEVLPGVHIWTGLGGAGMTLAFGLAEQSWENWS